MYLTTYIHTEVPFKLTCMDGRLEFSLRSNMCTYIHRQALEAVVLLYFATKVTSGNSRSLDSADMC
jgi:hypothetical protein